MASLAETRALDAADPLAGWRGHFALPPGMIYLDGNSLGALPLGTASRLGEVIRREWGGSAAGTRPTGFCCPAASAR